MWRNRIVAALLLGVFYLAIGRDLVALFRAKKNVTATQARYEVKKVSKDVKNIADGVRSGSASEMESPLALTSAAALANKEDPGAVDDWLAK